ncbi:glycosyltransferase family 4 protein [Geomesophilobacter sediminis]|uniref:Glycosyltransferase family 4 protein n=1 Tax=Geomesophilobacter sediminis TaxID=2798584 RepID=A0A8J7IX03_9BACT|nr:glycosyltransferase family 4 protein [Geomesophilobacter sediminis]MBJ6724262.1 glycosyltransferase family 4 protein [Geomesophilobacter sediminis]
MRIAFIAVKGMPLGGGIEKVTEEIGSRLVGRGHEVIVYAGRMSGSRDGIYHGMRVKTVPAIRTRALYKLSICLLATLDVVLREKVDLIHFHAIGPSLFSLFPRLFGIPTVVQVHGIERKRDKWGVAGRLCLALAELSVYFPNRVTAVSRVLQRYFGELYHRGVSYIPNGVSVDPPRPPAWLVEQGIAPRRYVLFVARTVEEKGAHFLIEAFRKLDTDFQLVIAGDDPHGARYQERLHRLAQGDPRILFTGFVTGEPLAELFSNAYLFCLPSTIEGLPLSLLEAMGYGNCCLVSDIPENLEAAGDAGCSFKNRDPEDLRRVLAGLIARPDRAAALRERAANRARHDFGWEGVTAQMEALYRTLPGLQGCPERLAQQETI